MLGFRTTNTLFSVSQSAARSGDFAADLNTTKTLNLNIIAPRLVNK